MICCEPDQIYQNMFEMNCVLFSDAQMENELAGLGLKAGRID